eukprot:gene3739-4658_t
MDNSVEVKEKIESGTYTLKTYTGEKNNLVHPNYGVINTPFTRLCAPRAFDPWTYPNVSAPTSREVSNLMFDQPFPILSKEGYTDMFNMWGQFLIHNMAFSGPEPTHLWGIQVPKCDPYFDPHCVGNKTMNYFRTKYVEVECEPGKTVKESDGKCYEQINSLSAYIDANPIYGSSGEVAFRLRSLVGGQLKVTNTQYGDLPPKNVKNVLMDNDAHLVPNEEIFSVGERRGNENPGLLSIHTVFIREHNRIAKEFGKNHPDWDDETLFQHARSCIIEQIQSITYKEYLPELLGSFPEYSGYDPELNSQITNEFTTAAFRFGHSEVGPNIEFMDKDGNYLTPLPIRDSYFNPRAFDKGIEPILRGLVNHIEQNIDIFIISDLRNFLFGKPGQGGLDLGSRNIQRNRDHGIGTYNNVRKSVGLKPVKTWSDISSSQVIQDRLRKCYDSIEDLDFYVGGIAEDHLEGCATGQSFYTVMFEQFFRSRKADRFWFERPEMREVNKECQTTTFGKLLERNTVDFGKMPENVFKRK